MYKDKPCALVQIEMKIPMAKTYVLTWLNMTKANSTFTIVGPKRAIVPKIDLIKSKIVSD